MINWRAVYAEKVYVRFGGRNDETSGKIPMFAHDSYPTIHNHQNKIISLQSA